MSLALQLSDRGPLCRGRCAVRRCRQAGAASGDATAQARLAALPWDRRAEPGSAGAGARTAGPGRSAYARRLPADALPPCHGRAGSEQLRAHRPAPPRRPDAEPGPDDRPARTRRLLGLIEARRNRAVVLRIMGRREEADTLLQSASDLARANGLSRPILNARLYRTSGVNAAARARTTQALPICCSPLRRSTAHFPARSRWPTPTCCAPGSWSRGARRRPCPSAATPCSRWRRLRPARRRS